MRSRPDLVRWVPLAGIVVVAARLALVVHRDGHHWGDDFSLYIRQTAGLVDGNWAQVIADNRFAVDNSAWHTFSPYVYPWGFPLLLAPFYAIWGLDYEHLKWCGVLALAVFLVCFNRITERRIGYVPALALTAVIGCSLSFVGQTNSVQSEIPFLATAAVCLWLIDRLGEREAWQAEALRPLVVLGALLAFAFNVRREGIALVVALAAVHVCHLAATRHERGGRGTIRWSRLATPYVTFAGAVISFQIVLPSVIAPEYPGVGFGNLGENIRYFRPELATQLGFSRPYRDPYEVLGSAGLGEVLFWIVVGLTALGLIVRLARHWRTDAGLVCYVLAVAAATGRLPFHEGRYLLQLTPFFLYFAAQALPSVVRLVGGRGAPARPTRITASTGDRVAGWHRAATGIVVAGLVGLGALGLSATLGEIDRTADADATGVAQWGPTHPDVEEMWAAVRQHTRADDVVAFFRARAMMLHTDRRSIQSGGLEVILRNADFYAMEKGSSYSQPDVSDQEATEAGMVKVWEGARFVLWELPQP